MGVVSSYDTIDVNSLLERIADHFGPQTGISQQPIPDNTECPPRVGNSRPAPSLRSRFQYVPDMPRLMSGVQFRAHCGDLTISVRYSAPMPENPEKRHSPYFLLCRKCRRTGLPGPAATGIQTERPHFLIPWLEFTRSVCCHVIGWNLDAIPLGYGRVRRFK